ncbi:MAG: hypothetical protein MPJ52_03865 [Alphaproteobacteria bacterium]|nr:hypothetical protein [Alphaproteobacteria bacterium]
MNKIDRKSFARQISEHLVVAELGRRGIVAAPFAGNVKKIDILAQAGGKSIALQVKGSNHGVWTVNNVVAKDLLDVEQDGEKQILRGKKEIDRGLIFVNVSIGDTAGEDAYYILTAGDRQDLYHSCYEWMLNKHNCVRPRNQDSLESSLGAEAFEPHRDAWHLVFAALGFSDEETKERCGCVKCKK